MHFRKQNLITLLALLGGVCLGVPEVRSEAAAPAAGESLDIEEALRAALCGNPRIRVAEARTLSAEGRARQASLWENPELELSAEDWPARKGGLSDSKRLVGLSQTLPFPGKKGLDRQIGSAGLKESEAAGELVRREVARELRIAFCRVLAAERMLEVARTLGQLAEQSAAVARKRTNAGASSEQEALRAEVLAGQALSEQGSYERILQEARQDLAAQMGRDSLDGITLKGMLIEETDPCIAPQSLTSWLPKHPALQLELAGRDRAELELRRARKDSYPDLKLGLAGGREGGTGASLVQFRASLPLPLIDRGKGKKLGALGNLQAAKAELEMTERRLRDEWLQAVRRVKSAADQVGRYKTSILPKAEEALRLVQRGYEEGKFGLIDLLDTQRTNAEVHLVYLQRVQELNEGQAALRSFQEQVAGEAQMR